jgi:hypothetical protein
LEALTSLIKRAQSWHHRVGNKMAERKHCGKTTDVGAEDNGEALRREANFELRTDHLFSGKSLDLSTAVDSRKKSLGGERAALLGRCHGCHDSIPFVLKDSQ